MNDLYPFKILKQGESIHPGDYHVTSERHVRPVPKFMVGQQVGNPEIIIIREIGVRKPLAHVRKLIEAYISKTEKMNKIMDRIKSVWDVQWRTGIDCPNWLADVKKIWEDQKP